VAEEQPAAESSAEYSPGVDAPAPQPDAAAIGQACEQAVQVAGSRMQSAMQSAQHIPGGN
jgi:hypothetical protein